MNELQKSEHGLAKEFPNEKSPRFHEGII